MRVGDRLRKLRRMKNRKREDPATLVIIRVCSCMLV